MPAVILVNPDALVVCKPELVEDPSIDPPPTDTGVPPTGIPPTIPPVLTTSCPPDTIANTMQDAQKLLDEQLAAYPDVEGEDKPKCVVLKKSTIYNNELKNIQECWVIKCEEPKDPVKEQEEKDNEDKDNDGIPDKDQDPTNPPKDPNDPKNPTNPNPPKPVDPTKPTEQPDGSHLPFKGCPTGTIAYTETEARITCTLSPTFVHCEAKKLGEVTWSDVTTECWGICYCNELEGITQEEALGKYVIRFPNSFGWRYKSTTYGTGCRVCWSVTACPVESFPSAVIAFTACRSEGNWQCETYVVTQWCWYWRIPVKVIEGQPVNWDRESNWNKRPTPHVDVKPPTQVPPVRPINCKTKPEIGKWF